MSRKSTTPPRVLKTPPPQDFPVQEDIEDSDPQEEDVPDTWSDELFPLNILPFSDDDNDNDDPDYKAPQVIEAEESTSSSSEDEEEDNMANVGQQANAAPVPAVSG